MFLASQMFFLLFLCIFYHIKLNIFGFWIEKRQQLGLFFTDLENNQQINR